MGPKIKISLESQRCYTCNLEVLVHWNHVAIEENLESQTCHLLKVRENWNGCGQQPVGSGLNRKTAKVSPFKEFYWEEFESGRRLEVNGVIFCFQNGVKCA